MNRAIIFDMDGVLIDSEPLHQLAEKKLLKTFGVEVDTEELLQYMGRSTQKLLNDFIEAYHLDVNYSTLLEKHKANLIDIFSMQVQTIKGIPEFITVLESYDIPCALASSSNLQLIQTVLNHFSWQERFTQVVSGEEIIHGKPAPDIFLETAKRLAIPPNNCIVIEDSNAGVRAGKAAGMRTIGFHSPNSHHQDISMADLEIQDFSSNTVQQILKWSDIV